MSTTYENSFVTLRMEEKIAYMELHNDKYNKVKSADFIDLDIFKQWITENEPIGLIIYGNGRHFSAGADLDYLKQKEETKEEFVRKLTKGKEILDFIEQLPIITVAAICGSCCGAGLEIALSCQFRVATESAIFAFPESSLGLMPGMGGNVRLPKLIGKSNAIKMIMTAERVFAEEALQIGLINSVTEKGNHVVHATKLINSLCDVRSNVQIYRIISTINGESQDMDTKFFSDFLQEKDIVV